MRHHHERGEQRADRLACLPADLEQRLGKAVPPARCQAGHARRLRDGRSTSRYRSSPRRAAASNSCPHAQARSDRAACSPCPATSERAAAGGPCRCRPRLEQRSGQLKGQRDQSDLREIQTVGILDERIDRRQQRLHHVVEQMREAERHHDRERAGLGTAMMLPRAATLSARSFLMSRPNRWSRRLAPEVIAPTQRQIVLPSCDYALQPRLPQACPHPPNERVAGGGVDLYRSA